MNDTSNRPQRTLHEDEMFTSECLDDALIEKENEKVVSTHCIVEYYLATCPACGGRTTRK